MVFATLACSFTAAGSPPTKRTYEVLLFAGRHTPAELKDFDVKDPFGEEVYSLTADTFHINLERRTATLKLRGLASLPPSSFLEIEGQTVVDLAKWKTVVVRETRSEGSVFEWIYGESGPDMPCRRFCGLTTQKERSERRYCLLRLRQKK